MIELGRSEEVILEIDRLANEDHTHIATEEELDVYRGNWWIRSNFVGSDTMPMRHRPDFKKALSTLHRLKKAEDKAFYQNWSQSSSSSSWWQWQTSWWHPSFETSPRRWTWHWSNGETWEVNETSIYVWHESHKEFGAKITVIISVTANAVHCHRRVCKEYISTTEKWLGKLYLYSNNINMSDEDNNHDTNYINKFHDANHDTRKLHMWARHVERAIFVVHSWCCVTRTSLAQVDLESSSHPHAIPVWFSLTSPSSLSTSTCPSPSSSTLSVLMHPEHYTDLDNFDTVQSDLCHSAKGSNDAYDVTDSLTAYKDTIFSCARHSSSLSFVPREMSLNIDMNRILPVKVSGVSRNLLSRSVTLSQSCNVVNPGKMFHSDSVGSPLKNKLLICSVNF